MAVSLLLVIVVVSLILLWSIGTYLYENHLERPSYSVIQKGHDYEIRMYKPYIVAETEVSGDYERASSVGFSVLADYIFGNNSKQERVAMTVPVAVEKKQAQEKISMTAPVTIQPGNGQQGKTHIVSFMMPSKYTLDTLPIPNNPAVTLRRVQERKIAAFRFSLLAKADRVKKKTAALKEALVRDMLTPISEPEIARYNAPFSNPLFRRNEILIEIE